MTTSLKLTDICDQFDRLFPQIDVHTHPSLEAVKSARSLLETAIASDAFILDCIEHELALIETSKLGSGLIPFFVQPTTGVQFSFGYWSPGASPGPHVHTAWTLTAVCRNTLNVLTYDTQTAIESGDLVIKKNIDATQGQVGFIHRVCVHEPINTSDRWTWTMHVTSPLDGQPSDEFPSDRFQFEQEQPVISDHPFSEVVRSRQRRVRLRYLRSILMTMSCERSAACLATCDRLGVKSQNHNLLITESPIKAQPHSSAQNRTYKLQRTHADLILKCKRTDTAATLLVDTPNGPEELVEMDPIAEPALQFVSQNLSFSADSLPGELSQLEQYQISETLENLGIYRSYT